MKVLEIPYICGTRDICKMLAAGQRGKVVEKYLGQLVRNAR